jgi:hypothetical protein
MKTLNLILLIALVLSNAAWTARYRVLQLDDIHYRGLWARASEHLTWAGRHGMAVAQYEKETGRHGYHPRFHAPLPVCK